MNKFIEKELVESMSQYTSFELRDELRLRNNNDSDKNSEGLKHLTNFQINDELRQRARKRSSSKLFYMWYTLKED